MNDTWKYSFILAASTLVIIFVSKFRSEMGRQFSREERYFPFFSIRVITACFCDTDISPFSKHSFMELMKGSLIKDQNFL